MNNPSSTSNFDDSAEQVPMGLQLFVPTRTAIVATACVAIVLLGLQLAYAKILLADNKDPITQRIKVLNRGQEAKILFFGSSRFHSCIKPRTIETTLGLKEGDVVNFAGSAMGLWEPLVLLRNLPANRKLDDKLVVIELHPAFFNVNRITVNGQTHQPPANLLKWGSQKDRSFPSEHPWQLKRAGWVKALALRRPLFDWLRYLNGVRSKVKLIEPPVYHANEKLAERLADDENFTVNNASQRHFNDYSVSPYWTGILDELLSELESRSANIVLLCPLMRKGYYDVVERERHIQAGYQKYLKVKEKLAAKFPIIEWESVQELGLDESIFVDYGHLNVDGGKRFSSILAKRLFDDGFLGR